MLLSPLLGMFHIGKSVFFVYDLLSAELEAEQITAAAPAELLAHLHQHQDRSNEGR